MMIYTAKLNKKLLFSVIAVVIIVALAIIFGLPKGNESQTTMGSTKLKNESDVLDFIANLGYETADDTLVCKEVTIPGEFDETYEKYNNVQKSQGLDLSKYKGKRVKMWSYAISNYPGYENADCIRGNILVYDGIVVGGDISNIELEGFTVGFASN